MDFADVINGLFDHMDGGFWNIKGLIAHPDLNGFSEQKTEMELLPVEFVRQYGDGDYGFHGDIYFPTTYSNGDGGVLYLHITFDA